MTALWAIWEQESNGRFRVRLMRDRPTPAVFDASTWARQACAGILQALAGRNPQIELHLHPEALGRCNPPCPETRPYDLYGYWASLWWDGKRRATIIGDHAVVFDRPWSPVRRSAPQAKPSILPGGVAKRNARVEIVTAFQRWHGEHGGPLIPALKEWCALYRESGAGVSGKTRAVIPSIAWNTLQRHRRKFLDGGNMALLPGKGGRTSIIDADPEMRAVVKARLHAAPNHTSARRVQQALAAIFPDRTQPGIASIRRFIRRWHMKRPEDLQALY